MPVLSKCLIFLFSIIFKVFSGLFGHSKINVLVFFRGLLGYFGLIEHFEKHIASLKSVPNILIKLCERTILLN